MNETMDEVNRGTDRAGGISAVIFDLDGVLIESEEVWHQVRHEFVTGHGGHWTADDQQAVMGANSAQWAEHVHKNCGVSLSPEEIYAGVMVGLRAAYTAHLPLLPGVERTVRDFAGHYPLAVASSSPREIIEYVLQLARLRECFRAIVSSDDVARGKPEPDVYVEACRRLQVEPQEVVAIEDSANGIRAARAAGMVVVAVPSRVFPPPRDVVDTADIVVASVAELHPGDVAALGVSARANRVGTTQPSESEGACSSRQ